MKTKRERQHFFYHALNPELKLLIQYIGWKGTILCFPLRLNAIQTPAKCLWSYNYITSSLSASSSSPKSIKILHNNLSISVLIFMKFNL